MCPIVRAKMWLVLAMAALVVPLSGTRLRADGPSASVADAGSRRQRVIVLRDGSLLTGELSTSGDRYILKRGGGEMQLAAANVLIVASTVEEAYDKRVQQSTPSTCEAHLAMAEWCMRHDLLWQAERELKAARALDSRGGMLLLLERRHALALEKRNQPVQPREAKAVVETPAQPARSVAVTAAPSAISELPHSAIERFTRKVQPVLVNNCTTIGCHQAGSAQSFQLDRAMLRGMSNQRTTMSNLAATLALVNREHPQESPLLTVTRRTHGGMKAPVFGPRQEQAFRHLEEWVALVAGQNGQSVEQPGAEVAANSDEAPPTLGAPEGVQPALYVEADGSQFESGDDTEADYSALTAPRIRFGVQLERWKPRDEFDPEIFNRETAARSDAPRSGTLPATSEPGR